MNVRSGVSTFLNLLMQLFLVSALLFPGDAFLFSDTESENPCAACVSWNWATNSQHELNKKGKKLQISTVSMSYELDS